MKKTSAIVIYFLSTLVFAKGNLDWHSQSNYTDVISTHVHLSLAVDFDTRQLKGYIEHSIKKINPKANRLRLDTRALKISKIELLTRKKWHKTQFTLSNQNPILGSALSIELAPGTEKVRVYYRSSPEASGLQWLTARQTAGKKHPFMFSQSQAIHARSWMPIQDTPAMRVTYTAKITTDKTLRPVMSANNSPKRNASGVYHFKMPQAIPPYLIAIAVGDIHYKAMSKQTAIYSEAAYLNAAAEEFKDTQSMIDATEKLYGKYRWNQYDLLILPPSFPFGGMENPRLSFITPTVLAGDKSLVSLIAHELAHSWSGNLVTNATWRDLWLNEGFTSYVENRIMEEVYGKKRAKMEATLGYRGLVESLKEVPEKDSILHIEIANRDPDEAFTSIPYDKGHLFLTYLEERFGRKKFDTFLRQYFDKHAFQSIDTQGFVDYINENLVKRYPGIVSEKAINTWIYQPGLPSFAPEPTSDVFTKVQRHIDSWMKNEVTLSNIPTQNWTVHEWLYFINNLPKTISLKRMAALDNAYKLTQSKNNEIAHAWLLLGIKRNYSVVNERLEDYMIAIGRRKLIVPLYKELAKNKDSLKFAKRIFEKARPGYHPLAQGTIETVLKNAAATLTTY